MTPRLFLLVSATVFSLVAASAEASTYSTVRSARHFAIGGVGYAGVTSEEELAMRTIRDGPRAQEQLRRLLKEGTPAGQMYALFALRQLSPPDYSALAEQFSRRSTSVPTISGCSVYTQQMSEAVQWIDKWARKIRTWEKKT